MANIITNVDTLPATPETGFPYFLTTAATVYPAGTYVYNGTGWACVHQIESIALTTWTATAISLTLCSGVTYTVTATAAPSSLAIDLLTAGSCTILKTGAYSLPAPTIGSKLTTSGIDARTATTNNVQIIVEKIGSAIIYSMAEVIAL